MADHPRAPAGRHSPVPLYFQAATRLQQLLTDGVIAPGERLPGEADLSARLGVARPTVRRAISHLVEQGVLARRRGAGVRVVAPAVRRRAELTSLFDDLADGGAAPRTTVRRLAAVPASDEIAAACGLAPGTPVTTIERLRLSGDEPLALMTNVVPRDALAPTREALEADGLYRLLRAAGRVPSAARQVVGARAATVAEAALLDERRGAPLLTMTRTAWDADGRLVEYGSHLYRASRYSFELSLGDSPTSPPAP